MNAVLFAGCGGSNTTHVSPGASAQKPPARVQPPLAGKWKTPVPQGATEKLVLKDHTYRIFVRRSDQAVGRASVSGQRITLSHSNKCHGKGTYRWHVKGKRLRFRLLGNDPCPRATVLVDRFWHRA